MDETDTGGRGAGVQAWSADVLAGHRLAELEAIIQCIPDGVYVGDTSGVRYCNQPALDMLGYRDVAELNRRIATLMDEVEARTLDGRRLAVDENVFVRALAGESAAMDVVVRHRSLGADRVLRSSAAPIRSGGAIIGAVAVNVDVTDERRAAQVLRTQRALVTLERDVLALVAEGGSLEAVLAALAGGMEALASPGLLASVLLVEDGRIRHVAAPSLPAAYLAAIEGAPIGPHAGSCGTAAFSRERVIVADIATDPLWAEYRAAALAAGLRACWSVPIVAAHDEVLGTVALYYRDVRAPSGVDLAVIDGTARVARIALERHHAEAARQRAEAERERVLAELRTSLHHNELLVGILGHDLRNPLAAVITGAELMLRTDRTDRCQRVIGPVVSSARRMARMIDQLLDLTRTRTGGGIAIRRAPCNLAVVLQSVVSEVELTFPGRAIALDVAGEPRGAWDADRLGQVCSNLLCNAAAHGEPGVPIRVRLDGSDPGRVCLEVANGGAMPADVLASLFDPFRRGPGRGGAEGLGLGLYITRELVRAHGGDVAVESSPTAGTTFRVELPRTG